MVLSYLKMGAGGKKKEEKKVLQIIYSFYKTLRESEMKVLEYISARESRSLNSVARFFSLSRTEQTELRRRSRFTAQILFSKCQAVGVYSKWFSLPSNFGAVHESCSRKNKKRKMFDTN
jgi:hypothetical protein